MRKTLPVILVFIALTNIVGFMPLYFSLLQEIKSEVSLKMAAGADLQKLEIADADYNNPAVFSITDGNEFKYHGHMYDYKTVKKTGHTYIFYALEDHKESNLVDFIKSIYDQSDENSKSSKNPFGNLVKNFSKDFIGSFTRTIVFPEIHLSAFTVCTTTCTLQGYLRLVRTPPDMCLL